MPQLRRFTPSPEVDSAAATLRGALEDAFVINPAQHLPIELAEPLNAGSKVCVWQALSGG